jgi:hypothetical protein
LGSGIIRRAAGEDKKGKDYQEGNTFIYPELVHQSIV